MNREHALSLSATDLIACIERQEFSPLTEMDAEPLKKEMAKVSRICGKLFGVIFNRFFLKRANKHPNLWQRRRRFTAFVARIVFPFCDSGDKPPDDKGIVMAFNHPSLNEPLIAILYLMKHFPDKRIIAPVNLPWYEGICMWAEYLRKIGIYLTPILTPATADKIAHPDMAHYRTIFVNHYMSLIRQFMVTKDAVVVAPSATRERYIFESRDQAETGKRLTPTMRYIVRGARNYDDYVVVPCASILPPNAPFGRLNVRKKYQWRLGGYIKPSILVKENADHVVRTVIATLAPIGYYHPPKIEE